MSSNSTECAKDDKLCIVLKHDLAVIIVPVLLLFSSVILIVALFLLRYCPERRRARTTVPQQHQNHHYEPHQRSSANRHSNRHSRRSHLQGIDAPYGLNPLEHEELQMTPVHHNTQLNAKPNVAAATEPTTERQHRAFSEVTALPSSIFVKPDDSVTLYRARMNNKDVVLRCLRDSATQSEKQEFLGFASFLSGLGPHPFIPALLGVVSVQPPLMMVTEELQHRDLLGFLWRCRDDNSEPGCDMTEKTIYTMARQVASALDYLHTQLCIHGNVAARSVLVGQDLTVKLWGLGSAYRRRTQTNSGGAEEAMELRKWQAPEVLARKAVSKSSDVWSFGILLYEMVTLGNPPFAQLLATELLQYLQRGKFLKRPAACSNSLYSLIKSCCQWNPQQRISLHELIRKLESGERSANGSTVLRVPERLDIGKYLREAGYGEAFNYAVL